MAIQWHACCPDKRREEKTIAWERSVGIGEIVFPITLRQILSTGDRDGGQRAEVGDR